MSDIDTKLNNTEEQCATKNVRLKCDTEGESLPLAPAGKPSSATPSSGDTPQRPSFIFRQRNYFWPNYYKSQL